MNSSDTGSWDSLQDWPLIGLHAVVMQDGRVMSFGTDSQGMQGGQFIYDVWDPVTGEHTLLENATPTDIFCSAAIILPGTNKIIIGGGDDRTSGNVNAGVDDVNFFDMDDLTLTQSTIGTMNYERWYPTMVSLPSGQTVIMGGTNSARQGIATPEIYTDGEGWRSLDGATDNDLAASNSYPRVFVNADGNITYFASGKGNTGQTEVRVLDPSGDGSLETIATLPFNHAWATPAIMYEAGKVLISATNGDVWTMDMNGPTPVFEEVEALSQLRNWSDFTVMADGKVLVNGGSANGNTEAAADKTAAIWDPDTGEWTYTVDEDNPRLYHSSSVLLADGTILSLGGGSAGQAENNYIDGQVYKPPYLYDENGDLADRPEIAGAPDSLLPGDTFSMTVEDGSTISKMTLVKNGAATHSFNMEARMVNLEFTQNGDQLDITLPANANEVTAGSWMLFAFDDAGVPAIAPVIAINPTLPKFDGVGDLVAKYFDFDGETTSLDQVDFEATPVFTERSVEINEASTTGAFYQGGPTDTFAVQYEGSFMVARAGVHTFHMTSDDGTRLFIDGELVIDHDGLFAPTLNEGTVELDAGVHTIELRYFENGGGAMVDLDWSGPGFNRTQMTFDGAEENLLVNGGLEVAGVTPGTAGFRDEIAGWSVEDKAKLWADGQGGQQSSSGSTFLEIEGKNGALSQSVDTIAGQAYSLSFDYTGRPGAVASSKIDVLWNGAIVATIEPTNSVWQTYQLDLIGTGGTDALTFSSTAGDDDGMGGLLDSVVLTTDGEIEPPVGNVINGTEGADLLNGTDADDVMNGRGGVDVLYGSAGNDIMDGGDSGYNQVNYLGVSDDYTVTLDADGNYLVSSAATGTDTLKNIDGIIFEGEDKWFAPGDLVTGAPGQTINGTQGDDELIGTSGDDVINGLGGIDGIISSGGSDVIDGGAGGYNQVDYIGASTDFTFAQNADGSVSVTKPGGAVDTLRNIDAIWFTDDAIYSLMQDLLPAGGEGQIINGTAGDDLLTGTNGNDQIFAGEGVDVIFATKGDDVIDGGDAGYNQVNFKGNAADFVVAQQADGSYTVDSAVYGLDTLTNIVGVIFEGEDVWYDLDELAG